MNTIIFPKMKKKGSVKYYLNHLPIDIINIIKNNIHFEKTYQYKNHIKKNKKLLKQVNKTSYYIKKLSFINLNQSTRIISHTQLSKKYERIKLQILMNEYDNWTCSYRRKGLNSTRICIVKIDTDDNIYDLYSQKYKGKGWGRGMYSYTDDVRCY